MIRWVVLDTNVLVSGFLRPGSVPSQLLQAVISGRLILVTSPALLAELDRVVRYPKLSAAFPDPAGVVGRIEAVASVVTPQMRRHDALDESDNRVLEAAVAGRAEAIVTGDVGLLALGDSVAGVRLVTPRQLVDLLRGESSP